jgi:uncharacterized membrane protein
MLALEKIMQKELIHMKKSILILILAGLLTACVPTENAQESSEIQTARTVTDTSEYDEDSESESYSEIESQTSTECEISTTEATVTTVKSQSETVCTTTAVTDVQKEENQVDPTESQLKKSDEIAENATDHTESSTEIISEELTENTQSELPQTTEATEVMVIEPEEYE